MALSGTVNSSAYQGRYVQLTWSASQSVANNTSTISWALKGAGQGNVNWYEAGGFYVEIAGNVVCNWSTSKRIKLYNGTSVASGSLTLSHNTDGSKSFSVSIKAGIYTYAQNCNGSGSFTLDTIARASQPSCITYPNNTQSVGNIGGSFTIHMNRASNSFTHTVRYTFGGSSGTIATGVIYNCSWTMPMALANQIPSATSGTGTIYVDTYNGSTKIGTKSCSFTATVPPSVVPTMGAVSVSLDNSSNSVIKGWGLYVAGYSKAKITATASGSCDSTIQSYTISGGYSTTQAGSSLSYTGGFLTSSGSKTFSVIAKDSRGRNSTAKTSSAITVYAYSSPTISKFTVARGSEDSRKLTVRADWAFSPVNGRNSATATLKYKQSSAGGWTTYGTIAKDTDILLTTQFQEELSYNFMVVVTDSIGNSAQAEASVSTANVLLDFRAGGKGLGIGKIAETDSLEVALDANFSKNVNIKNSPLADFVISYGTSGGFWTYRKWKSGLAECWGEYSFTATCQTEWGSLYECQSAVTLPNFPFTFASAPFVQITPAAGDYALFVERIGSHKPTTTNPGGFYAVRPKSTASASYKVNIYAIGQTS